MNVAWLAVGLAFGALPALSGCFDSERTGTVRLPDAALPSLEGRGLTVVVSPAAGAAGTAWVERAAGMLHFRPVWPAEGRLAQDWRERLDSREVEVAWVLAEEAAEAGAGLEAGEAVTLEGRRVLPVLREGSKWRGALNAAAKFSKETEVGR